jgi:hypothetical protein
MIGRILAIAANEDELSARGALGKLLNWLAERQRGNFSHNLQAQSPGLTPFVVLRYDSAHALPGDLK